MRPITKIIPKEMIQIMCDFTNTEFIHVFTRCCYSLVQPIQNPFIRQGQRGKVKRFVINAVQIHQHIPRRVPNLVGKIAPVLKPFIADFYILTAVGAKRRQRKSQRIAAVFVNQNNRVKRVAFGFGHLLPFFVADKPVDING